MKYTNILKVLLSFAIITLGRAYAGSEITVMLDYVNNSKNKDIKIFVLLEKVSTNDSYFCTETGSDFSRVPKKEFEVKALNDENGFYAKYDNDDESGFYCDFKIKNAALVIFTGTEFKKVEGQLENLKSLSKGYFPIKFGRSEMTGMRQGLKCKARQSTVDCQNKDIYVTRNDPTFYAELVID